jgi:hypothetical protein
VLGARVGGIPDLVEDGVNGILVDPLDTNGLAEALIRLLTDRELAQTLAAGAAASASRWTISPEEFARRIRGLVQRVTGEAPTRRRRPRGRAGFASAAVRRRISGRRGEEPPHIPPLS